MEKTRPRIVTVISVIEILWGSLVLLVSLVLVWAALWSPGSGSGKNILGLFIGPIFGIIGIFMLYMGLLTYKLKSLGRALNLIFFGLAIIGAIISREVVFFIFPYLVVPIEIVFGSALKLPSFVPKLVEGAIFLLLIIYLARPKVKKLFK